MTSNAANANIVNMDAARARRRGGIDDGAEFKHAGAHLAAVRDASGMTLEDAADRTHIKAEHLDAIEELNLRALPARPYVIGFVRTYAEMLGLDPALIVERFKLDAEFTAPPVIEPEKFEAATTASDETADRQLSLLAVAAIIAFMIWCSWQILRPREVTEIGLAANTAPAIEIADPSLAPTSSDVTAAMILERIEPIYPLNCAANANTRETVTLVFDISTAGRIGNERVAASSNSCFDSAALNAVRRWRFEPMKVDGVTQTAFDQRLVLTFDRP